MRFPFELKLESEFDAVGFGTNAVDHLIRVAEYPAHNSKVGLTGYSFAAGGEVASTMAGLRRLGMRTAYAGRFGGDREGELGIESLVDEGVDTTYCDVVADARTQIAFILIDDATGERTVIWDRDRRLAYSAEDAPLDLAGRGRVLHITPHDGSACIEMAKRARAEGTRVSVDIDNVFDGVEELLPLVDICIAGAEFPEILSGIRDKRDSLSAIALRYGCPIVGVTSGAQGSLIYCGGEFINTPGFPVPGGCVDTTGAGDAFRTGFLFGLLTGRSVEDSAVAANAVASLKCRASGARTALPQLHELDGLIKNS